MDGQVDSPEDRNDIGYVIPLYYPMFTNGGDIQFTFDLYADNWYCHLSAIAEVRKWQALYRGPTITNHAFNASGKYTDIIIDHDASSIPKTRRVQGYSWL